MKHGTHSKIEFSRLHVVSLQEESVRKRMQGVLEYVIMIAVVGVIAVTVPELAGVR